MCIDKNSSYRCFNEKQLGPVETTLELVKCNCDCAALNPNFENGKDFKCQLCGHLAFHFGKQEEKRIKEDRRWKIEREKTVSSIVHFAMEKGWEILERESYFIKVKYNEPKMLLSITIPYSPEIYDLSIEVGSKTFVYKPSKISKLYEVLSLRNLPK